MALPRISLHILVMASVAFSQKESVEKYLKSKHPSCDVITNVVSGDITGDKIPEAVFRASIECGQGEVFQTFGVFSKQNGKYVLTQEVDSLDWTTAISITKGVLKLSGSAYGPDDSPCCPSIRKERYYVLSGGQLVDQTVLYLDKILQNIDDSIAEKEIQQARLRSVYEKYSDHIIVGQVQNLDNGIAVMKGKIFGSKPDSLIEAGWKVSYNILMPPEYQSHSEDWTYGTEKVWIKVIGVQRSEIGKQYNHSYEPGTYVRGGDPLGYHGIKCFLKRDFGRNDLGDPIPIFLFGPCPEEKSLAARKYNALEKEVQALKDQRYFALEELKTSP